MERMRRGVTAPARSQGAEIGVEADVAMDRAAPPRGSATRQRAAPKTGAKVFLRAQGKAGKIGQNREIGKTERVNRTR